MARRLLSKLEKDARRRIGWITADNAGKVVTKDIYWTVAFLNMYLDRCDELGMDRPSEGLALALHAPNLSRLIGIGERPGEYRSPMEKASYEVLSLAVLGSLCRRAGRNDDAERNYSHAFDIVRKERIMPAVQAEILLRYGYFKTCLGSEDAIEYLDRAVQMGQEGGTNDSLAEALNARGHWYANRGEWESANRDFSDALIFVNRKSSKGKRTAAAAIVNLAFTIASGSLDFDAQTRALECIRRARGRIPRLTHIKCRLLWMEGIINRNLLFWRPAARLLIRARKGMLQLSEAADFVLVSLDLATVYYLEGETEKYKRLQESTTAAFEEIAGDEENRRQLLEALNRWRELPIAEQTIQRVKTQVESYIQSQYRHRKVQDE